MSGACHGEGNTSLLELPGGDLRAPIGFSSSPVYLDIKEAALGGIGPHGLCIGATGSGKSELLKSVVVSFAHQHTAEELNFILVDFKGGASFLGLERLPHTSAVITNLADEAGLVDRMQDSLLGEMHRRQERLRRANMTTAAEFNRAFPGKMPALFIVVDEFSELLHARPEFAEVFAAIGRLGRSLRMHLLLASQRLEEGRLRGLESHLSYRIALRTFSAVESRSLIGSTAAYELPSQPGAAILAAQDQVRFQSAYVSGGASRDQRLVCRLGTTVEAETTTLQLVVDRLALESQSRVVATTARTTQRSGSNGGGGTVGCSHRFGGLAFRRAAIGLSRTYPASTGRWWGNPVRAKRTRYAPSSWELSGVRRGWPSMYSIPAVGCST